MSVRLHSLLLHHHGGLNRIQFALLDHADLEGRANAVVIQVRDARGTAAARRR